MRLTILGGYLGAGKTTWLRHRLRFGPPVQVLVNEAAEVPIDDALLPGAVQVLAGGCACCTGRPALISALRGLADRASRGDVADVVLETSGLADPGAILAAIQADPVLVRHVVLDPVVVIVDAQHGLDQIAAEALARRQIAAADRIVISKSGDLARLVAALRLLNPLAEITVADFGVETALPPLPPVTAALPPLGDEAIPEPHPLILPEGTEWVPLAVWLSALLHARGDDIVRVKGVVATPAGLLLIQTVRRVVQKPEILPDTAPHGTLVFIGRGYDPALLDRSFRRLALGQ